MSGSTIAAPSPCSARAAIRASVLAETAAAALAAVKIASPTANIRRRPSRSPSAAPVSSSTANVSVYAFTVHSSDWIDAPRLRRIEGSAVVTTRLSRVVINRASETIARVQGRLGVRGDRRGRDRGTRLI